LLDSTVFLRETSEHSALSLRGTADILASI